MPSDPDPVVRCRSVTHEYRRGSRSRWGEDDRPTVTALSDVSLSISLGEFVGLTGPSGSGKSTLLHLLAGLETPTGGTIEFDGTDLATLSERQRTRLRLERVGVVFQRFHLLPSLSARANVALPLVEAGLGKRERRERASALLEDVGLGERLDHRPGELSGGEQQRVAVARALANDPDVVLADEPTGELDTDTGARVLDLLGELATGDRAVVVCSHDDAVQQRVDRELRLRDGQLV
jgi:putative ABC transport system ATP-binding protein